MQAYAVETRTRKTLVSFTVFTLFYMGGLCAQESFEDNLNFYEFFSTKFWLLQFN